MIQQHDDNFFAADDHDDNEVDDALELTRLMMTQHGILCCHATSSDAISIS